MNSIKLALVIVLLSGCAVGAEERRGASETTEAQLPASPELFDDAEYKQASAEITRHEKAEEKSAKAPVEESAKR